MDATIVQPVGGKLKKAIETDEENQLNSTPASKDEYAKWTIKGGHWYLGYKLYMRTDKEGFVEEIHVTAANAADVNNFKPVLNQVKNNATVYADKGYDSQGNRALLEERGLTDSIIRKAHKNKPLTREAIEYNKQLETFAKLLFLAKSKE